MCPSLNYTEALTRTDLVSLNEHHHNLCNALLMVRVTDCILYSHHYIKPPGTHKIHKNL